MSLHKFGRAATKTAEKRFKITEDDRIDNDEDIVTFASKVAQHPLSSLRNMYLTDEDRARTGGY
jgi:hypothetical protein